MPKSPKSQMLRHRSQVLSLRPALLATVAIALSLLVFPSHVRAVESPLADAAERADWPRVAALLKDQPNANAAQVDGMTALHWAAHHDDAATAKLLLAAGADAKPAN